MAISYNTVQDLSVAVNLKFQEGLNSYNPVYTQVAATISSSGSSNTYPLGAVPAIEEWVGERSVKEIKEYKYTLLNKKFGSAIKIPREALEDDEFSFYLNLAQSLGAEARQHPDTLLAEAIMKGFDTGLCYDGQPFFSENHEGASAQFSNLQKGTGEPWILIDGEKSITAFFYQERVPYTLEQPTGLSDDAFMLDIYKFGIRGRCNLGYGLPQLAFGSQAELTADSFEAALIQMLEIKKQNGNNAGIMPTVILVGPKNYAKALKIFKTMQQTGTTNVWYENVRVVLLRFLSTPAKPAAPKPIKVTLKTDKGATAIYTSEDGVEFEVAKTEVENGVLKESSRSVYEAAKKKAGK